MAFKDPRFPVHWDADSTRGSLPYKILHYFVPMFETSDDFSRGFGEYISNQTLRERRQWLAFNTQQNSTFDLTCSIYQTNSEHSSNLQQNSELSRIWISSWLANILGALFFIAFSKDWNVLPPRSQQSSCPVYQGNSKGVFVLSERRNNTSPPLTSLPQNISHSTHPHLPAFSSTSISESQYLINLNVFPSFCHQNLLRYRPLRPSFMEEVQVSPSFVSISDHHLFLPTCPVCQMIRLD